MTEAIVVVSQDRNEYYRKSRATNGHARYRSFGSPPCGGGFRDLILRKFQPANGILPTPIKVSPIPVMNQSFSPKTPSPTVYESRNKFVERSSVSIPININADFSEMPLKVFPTHVMEQSFSPKTPSPSVTLRSGPKYSDPILININEDFNEMFYSEKWAGPAYSNSPSPSSLPIPKFSSRPKRTVSLDLPSSSTPNFKFYSVAKSAPTSPAKDHDSPFSGVFRNDESATENLRRILNLDSADE